MTLDSIVRGEAKIGGYLDAYSVICRWYCAYRKVSCSLIETGIFYVLFTRCWTLHYLHLVKPMMFNTTTQWIRSVPDIMFEQEGWIMQIHMLTYQFQGTCTTCGYWIFSSPLQIFMDLIWGFISEPSLARGVSDGWRWMETSRGYLATEYLVSYAVLLSNLYLFGPEMQDKI